MAVSTRDDADTAVALILNRVLDISHHNHRGRTPSQSKRLDYHVLDIGNIKEAILGAYELGYNDGYCAADDVVDNIAANTEDHITDENAESISDYFLGGFTSTPRQGD